MTSQARQLADKAVIPTGRKNLIINGAMNVAQRGTTHTLSASTSLYGIDRWRLTKIAMDQLVLGYDQSSEVPTGQGFEKSLLVNVDTAETTLASDEYSYLRYAAEGQDLQQLAYGSSSAKSLTLSFWVRSSVTGDYGILALNGGADKGYTVKYTVNAANTWEKKTITISGDTSGSFNHDNTLGFGLYFNLGSGSDFYGNGTESWGAYDNGQLTVSTQVNLHATQNNKFYLTGVQLEVGSVATEFEHRSFGEELALCQRYYQEITTNARTQSIGVAHRQTTDVIRGVIPTATSLRVDPSVSFSGTYYVLENDGSSVALTGVSGLYDSGGYVCYTGTATGVTGGCNTVFGFGGSIKIEAEL
jgi:hypothetical protein